MAITATLLTSGGDPTITNSAKALAGISVAANRLLLVAVCLVNGTTGRTALVTASGLTFTKVEGLFDTNSDSLSWHWAQAGGSGFSGTVTITQNNSIQQMHWALVEVNGHDTTTPVPQNSGIDVRINSDFPATLASPVNTDSRSFIAAGHNTFQNTDGGSNVTILAQEDENSPPHSFAVGWSNAAWEAVPSISFATSSAGAALAIEVAAAPGNLATPTVVAATAAVQTPVKQISALPSAVGATATVQTPAEKITITPTAVGATAAVGAPTVSVAVTKIAAAVTATAAVPAPTPVGDFNPLTAITWAAVYWANDPSWTNPGNGNAVTTWRDGSGNSRDVTQATSAQRPIFRSSVANLNNKSALEFDDANTSMLGNGGFTVNQPVTIVAVLSDWSSWGPGDAARLVSAGSGFLQLGHGYPGTNDVVIYANGADFRSAGDTVPTTGANMVLWLANGASSKTSVNGGTLNTVSATPGNAGVSGADFTIGARQDGWRASDMKLAFLAVYSGDLSSDGQYNNFKNWVSSYYLATGATVTPSAVAATASAPSPVAKINVLPTTVGATAAVQAPQPKPVPYFPAGGSKLYLWADNFDDNSINAAWDDLSAGVTESGQKLNIAWTSSERYLGTLTQLDLTNSSAHVEVTDVGSGGTTRTVFLMLWLDGNNSIMIRYENGQMRALFRQGGVDNNSGDVAYNATNHRWWRIRHSGTTLHFETSADGLSWTNPWSHTVSSPGTFIQTLSPYLDIVGVGSPTGSASFDNFNAPPPPSTAVTVTPGAVNATGAVQSPVIRTRPVPAPVAATASIPAPTVDTGQRFYRTRHWASGAKRTWVSTADRLWRLTTGAAMLAVAVGATAAIPAPSFPQRAIPSAVGATAAVQAPTPKVDVTLVATPVAATAAVGAPTSVIRVLPATVGATATVQAPTARITVLPAAVTATGAVLSPSITITATPTAVGATAAVQSPTIQAGSGQTVIPNVVAATAAVGAPTVQVTIAPSTVTATAAVGSPVLAVTVLPTTVAATGAVQTPVLTATATVIATAVAATAAVVAPTLRITVLPTTVAATGAVQVPVLRATATVIATAVAATGAVGAPSFAITVLPASVGATGAVGAPTITIAATVVGSPVAAVGAVGAPTIQAGSGQTVVPNVVAATAAVLAPDALRASATVVASAVSATGAVGGVTLILTSLPSTVAATASVPTPVSVITTVAVVVSATAQVQSPTASITVLPQPVNAIGNVNAPPVRIDVTLVASAVGATASVEAPSIITGSGATAVATAVAATASVGSPTVALTVTPATVTATAAVGAPSIALTALPATVGATALVRAPSISSESTQTVAADPVAAVASVGTPVIHATATTIATPVAATAAVGAPTLLLAVTVLPSAVTATATIQTPVLRATATVIATTVAATADVGAPTVTATAVVIAAPVAASAAVGAPLVTIARTAAPSAVAALAAVHTPTLLATATVVLATAVNAVATVQQASVADFFLNPVMLPPIYAIWQTADFVLHESHLTTSPLRTYRTGQLLT